MDLVWYQFIVEIGEFYVRVHAQMGYLALPPKAIIIQGGK